MRWGGIIRGATAKNQVALRSIVSASKQIFCALKIANVWNVRTLKVVKRDRLFFMEIIQIKQFVSNKLQILLSLVLLDPQDSHLLHFQRKEKAKKLFWGLQSRMPLYLDTNR